MFKKSANNADIKKSQQKCIDPKKDTPTKLKHLKTVLENGEIHEVKSFLESSYSPIFHLFYDSFIIAESNLKQKGAFAVQRSHPEELECCLYILDKLLCLLPELLRQRWQCNALTHIFRKLLHINNAFRLRRESAKLFLLWYMIVGENKSPEMDRMFASLVPGFPAPPQAVSESEVGNSRTIPIEPTAIMAAGGEKSVDDISSYMLKSILDFMVSQVRRAEWKEKAKQQRKSFCYVFGMFRSIYLPYIFPNFNSQFSIYKPSVELPELRTSAGGGVSFYGSCQVVLIDWVKKYVSNIAPSRRAPDPTSHHFEEGRRSAHSGEFHDQASNSEQESLTAREEHSSYEDSRLIREIFFSNCDNVNFVHEVFRQALRLSFRYSGAMRDVILCYHDWIKMKHPDIPSFMLEPDEEDSDFSDRDFDPRGRPILSHKDDVRAGLQNMLQVFVTSASNVFLLVVPEDFPRLLDEQVDLCKLVLNIYRYMVMHTRMEQPTWEQLLIVLFHITSSTLNQVPHVSKVDNLGVRFASALFQTLVVSCIKANLSVVISTNLWDQLLSTLQGLTNWKELIDEWAKTMETLTKVLARHVYGLELNNLPLDRLTERKALKRAATKIVGLESTKSTLTRAWGATKSQTEGHLSSRAAPVNVDTRRHLSAREVNAYSSHDVTPKTMPHNRSPCSQKRRESCDSNGYRLHGSIDSYTRQHTVSDISRHIWYHHRHKRRLFRCYSEPTFHKKSSHNWDSLPASNTFSRSSDNIYAYYEDSRCPSPSSSGMDSASLKESPVQIDIGGDSTSIDTLDGGISSEQRSVMAGGSVRGWLPDVAVVLWRRVLGLLGDPNDVTDPIIHELIFTHLLSLHSTLIKLRDNLGISIDNQSTPEPPELVPPLTLLGSWCFRATSLPSKYSRGKLHAYRLLCRIVLRKHDVPLTKDFYAAFFRVLHHALVGTDQELINALISECGPNFFTLELPGSTMLSLDFICAANSVILNVDQKLVSPRFEAIGLMGSMYPLVCLYSSMSVLQPNPADLAPSNCSDVRDHLLSALIKSGKRDGLLKTRCLALNCLTVCLYHELARKDKHSKIIEIINVLLLSLKVARSAGQVAADSLLLLTDYANVLLSVCPEIPPRILQVLCQTLASQSGDANAVTNKESQYVILSMLFCLAEWCMRLPQHTLIQPSFDDKPILHLVFKVLNLLSSWTKPSVAELRALGLGSGSDLNSKDDPRFSNAKGLKRSSYQGDCSTIKLAAKAVTNHLVNHLWHFPLGVGAQRLSSLVVETDDLPGHSGAELTTDIFHSPHVQLFALDGTCLLSLLQLPALHLPGGASTAGFKTPKSEVRIIMRDLSGKFCWDASTLFAPPSFDSPDDGSVIPEIVEPEKAHKNLISSVEGGTPPRYTVRHRQSDHLPTVEDSADDLDNLEDLLNYIGHTSPEILGNFGSSLSGAIAPPPAISQEAQYEAMSSILTQRNNEKDYLNIYAENPNYVVPSEHPPSAVDSDMAFQQCRKIVDQLGLVSFERRRAISTLRKTEKLLRELKNLDSQKCRETHKVAVIYVANGQEDKTSILANNAGSEDFEDFVGGLGWEVELATHTGFMGGLQRNGSTGETAPYYGTSLTEVIFHVSSRMPSHTDENLFQKVRHLGNDEVHVVWSEHTRDYRRGIIPTEFCDVLIAIYPMQADLCRIQITTKQELPIFGPLFDGAIVDKKLLAPLVRATALNASRAKRSKLTHYQHFYEERSQALRTMIQNNSESTTFEEFVSSVYSPIGLTNKGNSRPYEYGHPSQSVSQSGLTAALLDGPGQSSPRPPLHRPTSYSVGEKNSTRDSVRNAQRADSPQQIASASPPVSSRIGKRQSVKVTRGNSPVAPPRKGRDPQLPSPRDK